MAPSALDRSRLTLRFADGEAERAYRLARYPTARRNLLVGLTGAVVLWLSASALAAMVQPPSAVGAVVLGGPALSVVFMLLALIPLRIRTFESTQLGSGLGNLIAGLAINILLWLDGLFIELGTPSAMLLCLFAYNFLGLRFVNATLSIVPYLILYLGLETLARDPGPMAIRVFLLLSVVGMSGIAAYLLEAGARTDFRQRRLIERQRAQIELEREKSERLLANVLPASIVAQLKENPGTIAEGHAQVTVLFADLVGFTPLAESLEPAELVELLDELFSEFDRLADRHGLEKIKTIGDAYMAIAGAPEPRPDHAHAVVAMAADMQRLAADFAVRTGRELTLRVGINTGPVVAGVIGERRFAYDLWGDTVNVASRMESHGLPGRIQLTEATWKLVSPDHRATRREGVEIKGKGPMTTYVLEVDEPG